MPGEVVGPGRPGHGRRGPVRKVAVIAAVVAVVFLAIALVASQALRTPPPADAGNPRLRITTSFATDAGVTVSLDAQRLGVDADVDSLGDPRHGTLERTSPTTVHYRPTPGYLGDDSFTYTVTTQSGGTATTLTGTVTLMRTCTRSATLVPTCGVWWGAAQVPGGPSGIEAFARTVGGPVPVAHLYASGGEVFPTTEERALVGPDGPSTVLFGNIKPTDEFGQTLTWAQVAAGDADTYLRSVAAAIREVDGQVFLTIHHEPEGEVDTTPGSGWTPADYVAMYRHVVQVVDAGVAAHQVVWVWTVSGYPKWESLWPRLFPGADVVDWIGYDPYLQDPAGCDFTCVINRTYPEYPDWTGFYDWATTQLPRKPLMLAEWAVRESPSEPGTAKAAVYASAPTVLPAFPRLRAVIAFNDDLSPSDPTSSRIETSQESLDAFRKMVRSPYLASAGSDVPVSSSRG